MLSTGQILRSHLRDFDLVGGRSKNLHFEKKAHINKQMLDNSNLYRLTFPQRC